MQKKFYMKLLSLILGILAVGIANSFVGHFTNFTLTLFLLLVFTVIYFLYKIPKTNPEYKRVTFNTIVMVAITYFILTYFLGLFLGFVRNTTALNLENIITVTISIIVAELIRYILVDKSQRKWWMIVLITITFVILNLTLIIPTIKFLYPYEVFKFIFVFLLPSISTNILLTYIAKKGNIYGNIAYRLIMELPIYLIPISPDLGLYMTGVFGISLPLFLAWLVAKITCVERAPIIDRNNKILINIISAVSVAITLAIVGVFSGWLKYEALVIATNSMVPDINKGDTVFVEKLNQNEQKSLSEGEVLVFKRGNNVIVHRVTDISNLSNDVYEYTTKGDANESEDSFKPQTENVIGRVNFKIPYIGWPTIWLNEKITKNS